MILIIDILLFIVLGIIVFQDMKFRGTAWILLPAVYIILFLKAYFSSETEYLVFNTIFNTVSIIIMLFSVTIYLSLKNKKVINIINSYLGIADILFFISISLAFSPMNYIAFLVVSMTITVIVYLIYRSIKKNVNVEIPLAGGMAAFMILLNIISIIEPQFDFSGDIILSAIMTL